MKVTHTKSAMMILTIVSLGVLVMGSAIASTTTTFLDGRIYWPGWENDSNYEDYTKTPVNEKDSIGAPEFSGGSYTIDSSGNLTSMSFNYGMFDSHIGTHIGDLFVDKDNNGLWDYVLSTNITSQGTYEIYDIHDLNLGILAKDSDLYETSTDYWGPGSLYHTPDSWYRKDHAVGVDETKLSSDVLDSAVSFDLVDYDNILSTDILFSGFSLELGQDFAFGFTMNCANDVIFETGTNPVPIPTSIFLLGAGLIGLAVLKRKKLTIRS